MDQAITIRIQLDAKVQDEKRGVLFDDCLSHQIKEAELQDLLQSARRGLWRSNESEGVTLGQALYRLLNGSGGKLSELLKKAYATGQTLYLDFTLPFELDALPVELLHDDRFLLLKGPTHIIRQINERNRLHQGEAPQKRPLTLLFIACSPIDLSDAVLQFEKEEEVLLGNIERFQVDADIEDSGSLKGLEEALIEAGGYDIVHISGHAGIDPELGPVFYMEDDTGHLDKVTPQRLWKEALRDYPPRLLFLSGCSTGKSDKINDTESYAHHLVEAGVSTVLGWGLPVSDAGATHLAAELYPHLAQGKAIDFAVKRGREALQQPGYSTWPLLRVFNDGSPWTPIIAPGQKLNRHSARKTVHTYLEDSQVKILQAGFIGRRREIQQGNRVLKGAGENNGLLIHGPAGVGKSCLAGKLIERFKERRLLVIHGVLEKAAILQQFGRLFDRYGIQAGIDILNDQLEYEDRIKALFRDVLNEVPTLLLFDDFEQNLERHGDDFQLKPDIIDTLKPILIALDWSEGQSQLIITSRYPFKLEYQGHNLPDQCLTPISLSSFCGPDLDKKTKELPHASQSEHHQLYREFGKGNPRLMEWLEQIAENEAQYNIEQLTAEIQGKSDDYIQEYLADIIAATEGADFHSFLQQASVYRQPVPAQAYAQLGEPQLLALGVRLTLIEKEQVQGHDAVYWVMPVIRASQWAKVKDAQKPALHATAYIWLDSRINNAESPDYTDLEEAVHHALASDHIRGACGHAIVLGKYLSDKLLYSDQLSIQQQVAERITDTVIEESVQDQNADIATLFNELGLLLKSLGHAQAAIEYYSKALLIYQRIYGDQHEFVATAYNNLGEAWRDLGDAAKASEYLEKALSILLAVFGDQHPNVATGYNNLGDAWHDLGDAAKAIEYYEKALTIDLAVFGDQHPNVAIRYNNLGSAWQGLGDATQAKEYLEKALTIDLAVFGDQHPNVARDYNNLGSAWQGLGDATQAIEYYEKALTIDLAVFGDQHPNVATGYNNLGDAWHDLGDAAKAIEYYEKALTIDLAVFGDQHPNVAIRYNNLGSAWQGLGDATQAKEYLEKALRIITAIYGSDHPSTKTVQNNLLNVQRD